MSDDKTADEQPKRKIAAKVIAANRRYFIPQHGVSVEAQDVDEAVTKAKKLIKSEEEEGDA